METIDLHDVVELTLTILETEDWQTREKLILKRGDSGTVVEVLTPEAFLVEFSDDDGVPYAIPVLHSYQLQVVWKPTLVGAA